MSADERKFIHDLSNPMAVALGNVRLMLRKMDEEPGVLQDGEIKDRLGKILESLNKLNSVLASRRQALIHDKD